MENNILKSQRFNATSEKYPTQQLGRRNKGKTDRSKRKDCSAEGCKCMLKHKDALFDLKKETREKYNLPTKLLVSQKLLKSTNLNYSKDIKFLSKCKELHKE